MVLSPSLLGWRCTVSNQTSLSNQQKKKLLFTTTNTVNKNKQNKTWKLYTRCKWTFYNKEHIQIEMYAIILFAKIWAIGHKNGDNEDESDNGILYTNKWLWTIMITYKTWN